MGATEAYSILRESAISCEQDTIVWIFSHFCSAITAVIAELKSFLSGAFVIELESLLNFRVRVLSAIINIFEEIVHWHSRLGLRESVTTLATVVLRSSLVLGGKRLRWFLQLTFQTAFSRFHHLTLGTLRRFLVGLNFAKRITFLTNYPDWRLLRSGHLYYYSL